MDAEKFPILFFALGLGWLVLVAGASAIYRKSNGKPVVPRLPADPLYAERFASARWANNCLMVAVTRDAIGVTPFFPFTLGFMPEVFRLEHHIPLKRINRVTVRGSAWSMNAVIAYGPGEQILKLKLRDVDAFADALEGVKVVRV